MSDGAWQDRIVGARMAVDQEFADRVTGSSFSRQQWGLIMTAVEFEIADPEDPDQARIVANTEQLPAILPELDSIEQQMQAMGGGGGAGGGAGGGFGGLIDSVKGALGLGESGESVSEDRRVEAEELTQAYADALQEYLETKDRWEEIRSIAADAAAED